MTLTHFNRLLARFPASVDRPRTREQRMAEAPGVPTLLDTITQTYVARMLDRDMTTPSPLQHLLMRNRP